MAEKSKTGFFRNYNRKEKERKIHLEEKARKLEAKLKDHDENCQPKIHDLEEEIQRLKEEITRLEEEIEKLDKEANTLREKIKTLEMKNGDLEESNTFLEKEANEVKGEVGKLKKKFELSEDELVIRQLCSSVQENLLRIVLQENFNEIQNKRTRYMEEYISSQIKDKGERKRARLRWKDLKKEVDWNEFLIKQLKPVKTSGNETAHPPLTEEVINAAKNKLEKRKKLGPEMVKAVDQLKEIWEKTNQKLTQGTSFQDKAGLSTSSLSLPGTSHGNALSGHSSFHKKIRGKSLSQPNIFWRD
ncbi:putative golgin subfamily A member 6-like protein 3 [Actinia tenebrosa]|uniref:Golgin subfamily A member 6-like protein 3 n=1 Tax=Actinia tenebrosa TaxID=6105 RepID=A0A6P8J7W7_ACTTE|nr:putative golgin subfamily A member 6-like protein 3 [Actinia tenebrosa]